MKLTTLAGLALTLFLFAACSKSNSDPDPTPVDTGVTAPTADTLTTGWIRGSAGTSTFSDIYFLNSTVGYAAGKTIFKTADGGISWDSVYSTNDDFSKNLAVAPDGKVFFINSSNQNVYKSLDAGKSFSTTMVNALVTRTLCDIFFTGSDTGYAVSNRGEICRTEDGSKNWLKVAPIGTAVSNDQYCSLYFLNGSVGWVSVGSELYKTNGDINTWTKCTINVAPLTFGTMSIFAPTPNTVYVGNGGYVFKSTDGGLSFSIIKQFPATSYTDVHFITESLGYVCCGYRIYKTTDGGATWQTVATTTKSVVEIHFTDASHGWACGEDGMTLRYSL